MKRFVMTSICMALLSIAANATDKDHHLEYFKRGVFVSVDFAAGAAFNERTAGRERNSSSGTDIAIGYRFSPHFALAIGSGAMDILAGHGPVGIRCQGR